MTLETRIEALELRIAPPADPWDVGALAAQRRREAAGLAAWYKRVKDYARSIGEDPEQFLEDVRRRTLEEELGPPLVMKLSRGRLHELKPGETVEPGTKTFLMYGR